MSSDPRGVDDTSRIMILDRERRSNEDAGIIESGMTSLRMPDALTRKDNGGTSPGRYTSSCSRSVVFPGGDGRNGVKSPGLPLKSRHLKHERLVVMSSKNAVE